MVAILSRQREAILAAVRAMYSAVATRPSAGFHFPVGRAACDWVGYPNEFIGALVPQAVESFAGVGCPFIAEVLSSGDVVLDVGSGSGTDVLIASARVGKEGAVIGLDLTPEMLRKLHRNARSAGAVNVHPVGGIAEAIPLAKECVDVVTSNGVLNLVPDKQRAVAEIHRVLRPGGRVQIADIVLRQPAADACRDRPELWAECVVGATMEDEYVELFRRGGFVDVEVISTRDYFEASESRQTRELAKSLGAHAIVLTAARA